MNKPLIIIVDENEGSRNHFLALCSKHTTQPEVRAISYKSILEELKQLTPILIVLNIQNNTVIDGKTLSEHILDRFNFPILLFIPENISAQYLKFDQLKYFHYIKSPYSEKEFLAGVDKCLYFFRLRSQLLECEDTEYDENIAELSNEHLFQLLLDNIPDGVYFKDTNSRFIKVNQAQADLIGVKTPNEAIGKSDFDFFGHADAAFKDEQQIIETGKPIINKVEEVVGSDKKNKWMSTTKVPIRTRNNEIIGTMGVSRNITEIVENEKAIEEQEKNFHSLISNLPEAVVVYNSKKIVFCNEFTLQLLGIKNMDDQNILEFIAKEYREKISESLSKLATEQKFPSIEIDLIDKKGNPIPVNVNAAPIIYHNEPSVLIVMADLRTLKKRENELQSAKEQLENMNTSLMESMDELKRFNEVMMAREGRVLELKNEINEILKNKNLPKKYKTAGLDDIDINPID